MGMFARFSEAALLATSMALATVAAAQTGEAGKTVEVSIAAQPMSEALNAFAQQTGLQVIFPIEEVRKSGAMAPKVSGNYSPEDALKLLLASSGLMYEFVNARTVAIRLIKSPDRGNDKTSSNDAEAGGRGLVEDNRIKLDEIIVTAQKKSERLQDVPVPVSVLSGQTLVDNEQVVLRDYYSSLPGLSLTPSSAVAQVLSIRGVSMGPFVNPTVGVSIDDVPYGASTVLGGGNQVPDIDPGDLDRIEVLRGPQGTLYGDGSLGGLLKFVTKDPSTDAVSGRVEAGTSSVYNGAELGYNFRASVNVPLSDDLAVRASAFTRQDPGYIDNPVIGTKGVNEDHAGGGRVSTLWTPSTDFSIKLSALYQTTKGDGLSELDKEVNGVNGYHGPTLGDLQQNYIPGAGQYGRTVEVYSATAKAKLGSFDLTSVSGYTVNRYHSLTDYTSSFGSYTQCGSAGVAANGQCLPPAAGSNFNGFGVAGSPLYDTNDLTKYSQEIRLSAPIGQSFEWMLGGFYTHEKGTDVEIIDAENVTSGRIVGELGYFTYPTTFEEYAAFTNLTYHVTERFDIQVGGRESQFNVTSPQEVTIGPYNEVFLGKPSPAPVITPGIASKGNAVTYLVTPRFKVSSDVMVYARFASGYRPGGPNTPGLGTPSKYDPDTTQDYELGLKGDFLDHTLYFDASLYYIDWKDIQINLNTPLGTGYTGNGSRAKSQGAELSLTSKPLQGLTIAGWLAFDDAVLTKSFPPLCGSIAPPGPCSNVYGVAGDRLPDTSRFSANLSLQQDFPLSSSATGFVGGQVSYIGDRVGPFNSPPPVIPPRQDFPAYTKTDLRVGVKYDSWTANLYVNNVTDVRGLLDGGIGYFPSFIFIYIQPRTAGISISRAF